MAAQREWFEKDYYKILGVSDTAPAKEITRAYRKLARELHPDKNPGNAAAEERFKAVSAAYDVLGDETKRAEYDEVRRLGPVGGGGPGGFTFNMDDANASGLGDLLGQMFGRRGRGGGTGSGAGPRRGGDVQAELTLDFVDAARGLTTTLHLTSDAQCSTCDGSGARPGTTPKLCPQCGGRGVIDDNQGLFSFSTPCRRCAGSGTVIEDPCPTCRGTGVEKRAREVQARIPAGVSDGQTIRLKGRGAPGRNGGPAGDLLVQIHVAPHPRFGRKGNDLTIRVPVSFTAAVLGADVSVPTLDGPPVTLRIKAGTQPGSRHRVRGKGIETSEGHRRPDRHRRRRRADLTFGSRAGGDRAARRGEPCRHEGADVMIRRRTQAVYVISVAAELAGMHPQTLRIYERRGLVLPARTQGGNRRYSDADIEVLRRIAQLADEGMNLEGIRRVMQLEAENERLRAELEEARAAAARAGEPRESRELVPLRQALAVFGERPGFLRDLTRKDTTDS